MTNRKITRRALVLSLLSLLLCCSMLVGTTFAWLTDSVTSGNNKIVAGNLDIELFNSIGIKEGKEIGTGTPLFDEVTLWEPGVVAFENLTVANVGTLALKYQLAVNFTGENDLNGRKLSDILQVGLVDGGIADGTAREAAVAAVTEWQEMRSFKWDGQLAANTPADPVALVIWWEPGSEDNNWNANNGKVTSDGAPLHIDLGINLAATQLVAEKDSFDNTYDESAPLDEVVYKNGGVVNMTEAQTAKVEIAEGAAVTINMDGNAIENSVVNDGDLEISGGTIVVADRGFTNNGNAELTNVTMNAGTASAYAAVGQTGSETVYNNFVLDSAGGGIAATNGAKVAFNSGSVAINSASTSGRYVFYAEGMGSEIVINGGEFSFSKTMNQKRAYVCAMDGTTVYINGGTFGPASTRNGYTAGILTDDTGKVIITGGTFGFDPTTWVAEGYEAVKTDSTWTVQAIQ